MKKGKQRLNPKTGNRYVKGDIREDGYVFVSYLYKRVTKDGFAHMTFLSPEKFKNLYPKKPREIKWFQCNPQDSKKRINVDTGKFFRRGDKRPSSDKQDKKLFLTYEKGWVSKEGFCREIWEKKETAAKRNLKKNQERIQLQDEFKNNPFPKRLNPKTNKPFVKGEKEGDKVFIKYIPLNRKNGFRGERWSTDEGYLRAHLRTNGYENAKRRAKKIGVPFDLDLDYLVSIFPNPPVCPVLGIDLDLGFDENKHGTRKNSPSMDRIFPEKGYVKGNIVFISNYANMIKQDANPKQIKKVAIWLEKEIKKRK